ncbi:hypothetical protein [Cohnella cellulosilytica]|uniref:Uncharacterized protein n=1 Tax=Cohnella cellulosilytica TaxID=986710 RepID=A0ABW2FCN9_9BACL
MADEAFAREGREAGSRDFTSRFDADRLAFSVSVDYDFASPDFPGTAFPLISFHYSFSQASWQRNASPGRLRTGKKVSRNIEAS